MVFEVVNLAVEHLGFYKSASFVVFVGDGLSHPREWKVAGKIFQPVSYVLAAHFNPVFFAYFVF